MADMTNQELGKAIAKRRAIQRDHFGAQFTGQGQLFDPDDGPPVTEPNSTKMTKEHRENGLAQVQKLRDQLKNRQ